MSIRFDTKFIDFNRWYKQNRNCERDIGKDVKFLHDALDKTIELIECANMDLSAYEGNSRVKL